MYLYIIYNKIIWATNTFVSRLRLLKWFISMKQQPKKNYFAWSNKKISPYVICIMAIYVFGFPRITNKWHEWLLFFYVLYLVSPSNKRIVWIPSCCSFMLCIWFPQVARECKSGCCFNLRGISHLVAITFFYLCFLTAKIRTSSEATSYLSPNLSCRSTPNPRAFPLENHNPPAFPLNSP